MKRLDMLLTCTAILALGAQTAGSQSITLDTNDVKAMFAVGNVMSYHIDTLTVSANIGTPGSTAWDFSGLGTTSLTNLESLPVASTPYAANFPQATIALRDTGFTYSFYYATVGSDVTLKGTAFIYHTLQDDLTNLGLKGAGNAYGIGGPLPAQGQWVNTPASVDYDLPLQFNKSWANNYSESISGSVMFGTLEINFGPIVTTHAITYTVDAYGTLTLPGAQVQQALRIKKSDRSVSGGVTSLRVGYLFFAKNGASVQLSVSDTNATSGAVGVYAVRWSEGVDVQVPIQLASFTASFSGGESVTLTWMTISETENFGFYVQKKAVGQTAFTDVPGAFISGHGTTVIPQNYSYIDHSASPGALWYRLRQVDLDGAVHYSEPVQVSVTTDVGETLPDAFALEQNFPNPFNPSTIIQYSVGGNGHETQGTENGGGRVESGVVRLVVYDLLGQQVAVLVNERHTPGRHQVTFDGSGLSSGVYLYRLQAGGFVETKQLLLVR